MKKVISILLCLVLILSLAACGSSGKKDDGKKTVGILQLVQHEALDAATQGFKDAVTAAMGDKVTFIEQNASGDTATCSTIANQFVSEGVDMIMANATPALQAAAAATNTIPILGTSVTDYPSALGIAEADWKGHTGTNISGTSDLAPLDEQAKMFPELLPGVKKIGILYCSAEANSIYQADVVKAELEKAGLAVNIYTFADSNDVASVTQSACDECDALYIPTDNTAASCTEAINNVAQPAGVPIIAGEEGLCKGCGIATLSISYYELGVATGEMAAKILKGEANVAEMEIGYDPNPVKKYNPELVEALGVTIPDDYTAIEG